MNKFLKGMLKGFVLGAVSSLAGLSFVGIILGVYLIFHKLNLPWWVGYLLIVIVLYSIIGGIVEYFD
jgi:hypothetical protein